MKQLRVNVKPPSIGVVAFSNYVHGQMRVHANRSLVNFAAATDAVRNGQDPFSTERHTLNSLAAFPGVSFDTIILPSYLSGRLSEPLLKFRKQMVFCKQAVEVQQRRRKGVLFNKEELAGATPRPLFPGEEQLYLNLNPVEVNFTKLSAELRERRLKYQATYSLISKMGGEEMSDSSTEDEAFVKKLLEAGGLKAADEAYQRPPMLHSAFQEWGFRGNSEDLPEGGRIGTLMFPSIWDSVEGNVSIKTALQRAVYAAQLSKTVRADSPLHASIPASLFEGGEEPLEEEISNLPDSYDLGSFLGIRNRLPRWFEACTAGSFCSLMPEQFSVDYIMAHCTTQEGRAQFKAKHGFTEPRLWAILKSVHKANAFLRKKGLPVQVSANILIVSHPSSEALVKRKSSGTELTGYDIPGSVDSQLPGRHPLGVSFHPLYTEVGALFPSLVNIGGLSKPINQYGFGEDISGMLYRSLGIRFVFAPMFMNPAKRAELEDMIKNDPVVSKDWEDNLLLSDDTIRALESRNGVSIIDSEDSWVDLFKLGGHDLMSGASSPAVDRVLEIELPPVAQERLRSIASLFPYKYLSNKEATVEALLSEISPAFDLSSTPVDRGMLMAAPYNGLPSPRSAERNGVTTKVICEKEALFMNIEATSLAVKYSPPFISLFKRVMINEKLAALFLPA